MDNFCNIVVDIGIVTDIPSRGDSQRTVQKYDAPMNAIIVINVFAVYTAGEFMYT